VDVSFRHPFVLALLLAPALLLWWTWRRRGGLVLPLDHGTAGEGRVLGALVRAAESLPALALAVVVLILAGPQRWDEPRSKRALTNIEFCVDVSGSMNARFGDGTRYDASMKAVTGFVEARAGDAFGLTFFGTETLHWVPLTTDSSAFRCALPFMRPGNLPPWFNGTEIGEALLACRRVLAARPEGDRMIVLVTDGFSADLNGERDDEVLRALRADRIVLYTIHTANTEVPAAIVDLAVGTGGQVFAPDDEAGLQAVFEHIDEMQVTRLEKVRAESMDDYALLCWTGLGLAAGVLVCALGLRTTPW